MIWRSHRHKCFATGYGWRHTVTFLKKYHDIRHVYATYENVFTSYANERGLWKHLLQVMFIFLF